MYPLKGELQDLQKHRGVTVELKGWGEVMEGQSRRELQSHTALFLQQGS